jgi:outer membrane protein
MKRSIVIVALLSLGLALASAAQTPAAPGLTLAPAPAPAPDGPQKIAVIAFQSAVSQTNEFQRNFLDLQRKFEPQRQELKTLSDEIDSLTKQLQTQGDSLAEDERARRARAIDLKKTQFDRKQQEAANDFQQQMQEIFSNTASKVFDVLGDYAEKNGLSLVLDIGGQQTPIMYVGVPSMEITKIITDSYNVKSGIPAPPQPPAGAPAPSGGSAPGAARPPAPKPATPKPPAQ